MHNPSVVVNDIELVLTGIIYNFATENAEEYYL